MPIQSDRVITSEVITGIVPIIFGAQDQGICGGVVERAPDNGSGSAGSFAPIGTLNFIDPSGTPYVDILPMDGQYRYYRAKHVKGGFQDSNYTDTVRARPDVIPADIDFNSKPWLYDGNIPLQLVMDLVSETTGSLVVSASINRDPANLGTPVVSVLSYYGVSSPISLGSNSWQINKPASGVGRVSFENTLAGRQSGLDTFDIQAIQVNSTGSFLALVMTEVSSSATAVTVSGSVVNPAGYPVDISLYRALGITPTPVSPGVWSITRPAASFGSAVFHVTSSVAGVIDDFDTVDVDSQNIRPLSVLQRVTGISTLGISASFDIRDPFQPSGSLSGIGFTITSESIAGFTVTTGGINNANGVYEVPITATFPDFGSGFGHVTCKAVKLGMVPDSDTLSVPERTFGVGHLRAQLRTTALGSSTVTVSGSAIDPTDISGSQGVPTLTFDVSPTGSVSYTGTNPWVVNRPLSGSITAVMTATRAGKVSDSAEVTITANAKSVTVGDYLSLVMTQTAATATTVTVSGSVYNPLSRPISLNMVASLNDAGITGTNPYTITRPTDALATYTFHVSSSDAGVVDDYDMFYVSPTNTAPLQVIASPTAVSSASISVGVQVRDPYNTTGTLSGITMTSSSTANAGMSSQLTSIVSSAGYTTYNYFIIRPDLGTGSGRYTYTANKTGYTPDADSVDIPEKALIPLGIDLLAYSGSSANITLSVTGSDATGGAAPTIALTNPMGISATRNSTTDYTGGGTSTVTEVWTVARPDASGPPAGIVFTVTKPGRQSISAPFTVTSQTSTGGDGTPFIQVLNATGSSHANDTVALEWTGMNLPAGGYYNLQVNHDASWTTGVWYDYGTVTSPLNVNMSTAAESDLVNKGTGGYETVTYQFKLTMKNSGGATQAVATTSWVDFALHIV